MQQMRAEVHAGGSAQFASWRTDSSALVRT